MYKNNQTHFPSDQNIKTNNEANLKVFLYVYVNVSICKIILLDDVHLFVSIFVVYQLKSPLFL